MALQGIVAQQPVVDAVRLVLVGAWAAAGLLLVVRRRSGRSAATAFGAAALGSIAIAADDSGQAALARMAIGALVGAGFHLIASLPDGRPLGPARWTLSGVVAVIAAAVGLIAPHDDSGPEAWPFVALSIAAIGCGFVAAHGRYRRADAVDRRRMQWIGWGAAATAEVALVVAALGLLADWPSDRATVVLASTVLVPVALAASTDARLLGRVDRLLTGTVVVAGLTALLIAAGVAVVVAHGRSLSMGERTLLTSSMAASLVAALVFLPLRDRLTDAANQLVYGQHSAPDEALRTWGNRLTRAIPLDELLLQLTESLRKSMSLASAEIYTGSDGIYELAAGVPHRSAGPIDIGPKELPMVTRAGVSGGTWLDIWIPGLAGDNSANTRIAPIVHGGHLLGLIVVTRDPSSDQLSAEDDRVLTELARQVGVALHNVQLDSALQASLDALQATNVELQRSRQRIVSAGDSERRRIERNLHDGAQQHLVAMAVKLRMAEELVEDDPAEAAKVIEELRNNLKDAISELRALAHGIFPPLLSSGGLREALPAAAGRSSLYTTVDTEGTGRYSADIETTVYFCCLEAVQNAGKHAGDDARIEIRIEEADGRLVFEIRDDGVGFVPDTSPGGGHGFVNMADRLGTVNGRLDVRSAPGQGTTIRGEIPLR